MSSANGVQNVLPLIQMTSSSIEQCKAASLPRTPYVNHTQALRGWFSAGSKRVSIDACWITQLSARREDIFPEILPEKKSWGTCEGEPCKTLIDAWQVSSGLLPSRPNCVRPSKGIGMMNPRSSGNHPRLRAKLDSSKSGDLLGPQRLADQLFRLNTGHLVQNIELTMAVILCFLCNAGIVVGACQEALCFWPIPGICLHPAGMVGLVWFGLVWFACLLSCLLGWLIGWFGE